MPRVNESAALKTRRFGRRRSDGLPSVVTGRVLRLLRQLAHRPGSRWPGVHKAIADGLRRLEIPFAQRVGLGPNKRPALDLWIGNEIGLVLQPGDRMTLELIRNALALCTADRLPGATSAAVAMVRLVVVLDQPAPGDLPVLINGRQVHWVVLRG